MHHQCDFDEPLLNETLIDEPVRVDDDSGAGGGGGGGGGAASSEDAGASRARRRKNYQDQTVLRQHLQRYVQRVMMGEATQLTRERSNTHIERNFGAAHRYDEEQMRGIQLNVRQRLASRQRAESAAQGDWHKRQFPVCGVPPPTPTYIDTKLPLVEFDNVLRTMWTRESTPNTNNGEVQCVEHTLEELIEDERQQLTTQAELSELRRTMAIIHTLHLGGVDVQAHNICVEDQERVVTTAESGLELSSERVVAIDSRNFLRVMGERIVDRTRTSTNSILDTQQVLGRVAARNKTYAELRAIIRSGNSFVDHAHLWLLANAQWAKGWCMPFTIHGLKQVSDDVIQQISFETTATMVRDAVTRQARNKIVSPSTCIALGTLVARVGTQACTLVHDATVQPSERAYGPQKTLKEFISADVFAEEMAKNNTAAYNPFQRMPHLYMLASLPTTTPTPLYEHDEDALGDGVRPQRAFNDPTLGDALFAGIDQQGSNMHPSAVATGKDAYDPITNSSLPPAPTGPFIRTTLAVIDDGDDEYDPVSNFAAASFSPPRDDPTNLMPPPPPRAPRQRSITPVPMPVAAAAAHMAYNNLIQDQQNLLADALSFAL
jgi:hypothetical protein